MNAQSCFLASADPWLPFAFYIVEILVPIVKRLGGPFPIAHTGPKLAAHAILAHHDNHHESLAAYEMALEQEILPDFRVTARIAQVIYAFPRLAFKLLGRYQDVVQDYFEVLQGRTTAAQFLPDAKKRLKASVNDLLLEALHLR